MIRVRITAKGEPDVPELTRAFEYSAADEEIFFGSAALIEERLRRGMNVNVNEALVLYCSHVVKSIRAGKQDGIIQDEAARILSPSQVMIGVPETLRLLTFEAKIDNEPARNITLKHPISKSGVLLADLGASET